MAKGDVPAKYPKTIFLTGLKDDNWDDTLIHRELSEAEEEETTIAEYKLVRVGVTSKQTTWEPASK